MRISKFPFTLLLVAFIQKIISQDVHFITSVRVPLSDTNADDVTRDVDGNIYLVGYSSFGWELAIYNEYYELMHRITFNYSNQTGPHNPGGVATSEDYVFIAGSVPPYNPCIQVYQRSDFSLLLTMVENYTGTWNDIAYSNGYIYVTGTSKEDAYDQVITGTYKNVIQVACYQAAPALTRQWTRYLIVSQTSQTNGKGIAVDETRNLVYAVGDFSDWNLAALFASWGVDGQEGLYEVLNINVTGLNAVSVTDTHVCAVGYSGMSNEYGLLWCKLQESFATTALEQANCSNCYFSSVTATSDKTFAITGSGSGDYEGTYIPGQGLLYAVYSPTTNSWINQSVITNETRGVGIVTYEDSVWICGSNFTSQLYTGAMMLFGPNPPSKSVHHHTTGSSGLAAGLIAAGCILLFILLVVGSLLFIRRRRRKGDQQSNHQSAEIEMAPPGNHPRTETSSTEYSTGGRRSMFTGNDEYAPSTALAMSDSFSTSSYKTQGTDKAWVIDYSEIKLETKIGNGAFGEVYRARWRGIDVAVKQTLVSTTKVESFLAEAEVMKKMRPHSNITQLFGVCTTPLCIVTEYVANGSLLHWLQHKEPFDADTKIHIARGIAAGMMHLHSEGIFHRDLAARNILLDKTLSPKVADFGMSRINVEDSSRNQTQTTVGPIRWMAPEALTQRMYNTKTDVWSYGVTLYELLTHRLPYEEMEILQVCAAVMMGQASLVPRTEEKESEYPPVLVMILKMCLDREPSNRPEFQQIVEVFDSQ